MGERITMKKGKQQKGERKRRSKATLQALDTELGWTKRRAGSVLRNWTVMVSVLVLIGLVAAFGSIGKSRPERPYNGMQSEMFSVPKDDDDGMREQLETAEAVARAFLKEADPSKRLKWVRYAEEVNAQLAEYTEEARAGVGEIQRVLGHQGEGANPVTAFVVAFPSGNVRLLEVVGTADGPLVDWDAYARYGTASWKDLLSGKAERAVVRVFCEPSSERPEPFGDQARWTCFRLSSPDLPQAALAFAEVGSVREGNMKHLILNSTNYRQRFVLEIVRHQGKDEPLFEISGCMAVGWMLGERPVEETWEVRE